MSCFVKMKGVRLLNRPDYHSFSGGLRIAVVGYGGKPLCTSARNFYIGDSDWMAQSLEFTYDPKGQDLKPSVDMTFYVADGTAWIEGLRVEELGE